MNTSCTLCGATFQREHGEGTICPTCLPANGLLGSGFVDAVLSELRKRGIDPEEPLDVVAAQLHGEVITVAL